MQRTIYTESLISEVRLRPGLWDASHISYKDKHARKKLWEEICEALNPDYRNESRRKRQELEKAVHQRWKTARDAYIRHRNQTRSVTSPSGGSKRKKYAYYEELKFLDKRKLSKGGPEDTVILSNTSESDVSEYNTLGNEFVECPNTESLTELDQDHISDSASTTETQTREGNEIQRKRKTSDDKCDAEMLRLFKDNANMLKNDDLAFFVSLLPVTEKFTIPQKLIFRAEVLKKAMEISGMQNPFDTYTGPSSSVFPFKSET